jgi:hypothetical protein
MKSRNCFKPGVMAMRKRASDRTLAGDDVPGLAACRNFSITTGEPDQSGCEADGGMKSPSAPRQITSASYFPATTDPSPVKLFKELPYAVQKKSPLEVVTQPW